MEIFLIAIGAVASCTVLYFIIKTAVRNAITEALGLNSSPEEEKENHISQIICPNCKKNYDIDYPKCPHCKHQTL